MSEINNYYVNYGWSNIKMGPKVFYISRHGKGSMVSLISTKLDSTLAVRWINGY